MPRDGFKNALISSAFNLIAISEGAVRGQQSEKPQLYRMQLWVLVSLANSSKHSRTKCHKNGVWWCSTFHGIQVKPAWFSLPCWILVIRLGVPTTLSLSLLIFGHKQCLDLSVLCLRFFQAHVWGLELELAFGFSAGLLAAALGTHSYSHHLHFPGLSGSGNLCPTRYTCSSRGVLGGDTWDGGNCQGQGCSLIFEGME